MNETPREILERAIASSKAIKKEIKKLEGSLAENKEIIITELKHLEVNKIITDKGSATISTPKSFDKAACKKDYPEDIETYTERKEITKIMETFKKNLFKFNKPQLWAKYQKEGTTRLTLK